MLGQRRPSETRTGERRRGARWFEAVGLVGIWVAAGAVFRLDANQYLLLGIPLTVAFQVVVRRRPLHELWVRNGPRVRQAPLRKSLIGLLAVVPLVLALQGLVTGQVVFVLYGLAAAAGATGVVYAAGQSTGATRSATLKCAAVAGPIATIVFAAVTLGRWLDGHHGHGLVPATLVGLWSFALYLPAVFVVEEVTFRGAIDSHVHHDNESRGLLDAVGVSALWGLWHLPITDVTAPAAVAIVLFHIAVGVPLSFAWRRSGNLLASGVTHAAIDAVRNLLLAI